MAARPGPVPPAPPRLSEPRTMVMSGRAAAPPRSQQFHRTLLGIFTPARATGTRLLATARKSSLVRRATFTPCPRSRAFSLSALERDDERAEDAEGDAVDAERRQRVGLEELEQELDREVGGHRRAQGAD